jgi:predicted esterase
MNKIVQIFTTLLLSLLASCASTSQPIETVPAIEKTDICLQDTLNTYQVYIPQHSKAIETLPLLLIIDAHGSGQYALNKFKQAANTYPAIIVASNYVKNGFTNYPAALQTLLDDVRHKYPVGQTLFIAGFSGGARMALNFAQTQQFRGLILCGALANADELNAIHCPIISISGMDDFNFIETAQYLFQEQLIPQNLKIELTNQSHSWPDSLTLANAFGFLYLSGQLANTSIATSAQLSDYNKNEQQRIDTFKNQGDYLKAAQVARNMSTTEPFKQENNFAATYNELKATPEYSAQLNRLKNTLQIENSLRQQYIQAFSAKDSLWWKNEISLIDQKIKTEPEPYMNNMYLRIKSYWGIACYSLGNQAAKQQNAPMLNKILAIYRTLEPENPDMIYLSAFPYFWKKDNAASIIMLKKACSAGFTDMNRLQTDFPASISSKL